MPAPGTKHGRVGAVQKTNKETLDHRFASVLLG